MRLSNAASSSCIVLRDLNSAPPRSPPRTRAEGSVARLGRPEWSPDRSLNLFALAFRKANTIDVTQIVSQGHNKLVEADRMIVRGEELPVIERRSLIRF